MNNQDNNTSKTNWFVRSGLILIVGLIISMIVYKFFCNEPIAEISKGLIMLLAFAVILVLSESFDNFSVGKILTLSRKVKERDATIVQKNDLIKNVENRNTELISQIFSLSNNFSQSQSNTNIIHHYASVQDANNSEKISKQKELEKENKEASEKRRIDFRKVEEIAFHNYLKNSNIDVSKLKKDVKLQTFESIDPISDNSPVYDGYVNDIDKEVIIEIKLSTMQSLLMTDRLYIMLNKIHQYKQVKKTNCYLNLILVEIHNEDNENRNNTGFINRIYELFRPALNSGLLRITPMKFESEDMKNIYRKK